MDTSFAFPRPAPKTSKIAAAAPRERGSAGASGLPVSIAASVLISGRIASSQFSAGDPRPRGGFGGASVPFIHSWNVAGCFARSCSPSPRFKPKGPSMDRPRSSSGVCGAFGSFMNPNGSPASSALFRGDLCGPFSPGRRSEASAGGSGV
jgi:hypothetical protein